MLYLSQSGAVLLGLDAVKGMGMGKWGEGEMGRQGDKGTRGQGDKGTRRQGDKGKI